MKKVSQIKGGVILSYLTIVVSNVVAMVYTPIMIRLLGQSEYGLYTLVNSFVSYLGLMDFGFGSTYMRYYSQYKYKESKGKIASLNGMFLTVFSVIGFLALIAGLIMSFFSDQIFGSKLTVDELSTARILFIMLTVTLAINFPSRIFQVHITANERFVFLKTINLIQTVINPLVMIPLLLMGYKSIALVATSLAYTVIVSVINIFYCIKKLDFKISFRNFEFRLFKDIAGFAFFVFLGEIVDEVNWNVDKFILGRFSGTIAVAIYGIAAQINLYYRQFSSAISQVFIPRINKIVATEEDENKSLTDLMIRVGRIQFIVLSLVLTGFIFVGRAFCVLWAGPEYEGSFLIAIVLLIPSTIPLIQNVGYNALVAKGKHKFRSIIYFLISLANVAISIPLCSVWGGLGAAIGTAIAVIVGNGFIINWYDKKLGIGVGRFWKSILSLSKGLIMPIAVGSVFLFIKLPYNWLVLFAQILLYSVIFLISMYTLGFNDEEKGYFSKIGIKIKKVFIRKQND